MLTMDLWQRKLPGFTSQQAFPKLTCPSSSEVGTGDSDGDKAPATLELSLVGRQMGTVEPSVVSTVAERILELPVLGLGAM